MVKSIRFKHYLQLQNSKSSCLKSKGNYVANKSNFTASAAQVGISAVVGAAGYIPYAGGFLTFFDIIKTVNSAFSPTTTISNAEALCSYSVTQTAAYNYVKDYGKSNEKLVMHSNQVKVAFGWQFPGFTVKNGSYYPNIIQKTQNYTLQQVSYNSALYATTSFINNHGNSPQTVKSAWLQVLSNSKSIGFYIPANPASRY